MSDETAPQSRIKITWLIGTMAALALFVVIGAYSKRMTWTYTDYDQDRAAQRYTMLAQVRHDEQALLSPVDAQGHPTAEWVDQSKGIVRIPIEEAMDKEIDTLKAEPVAMGAEIPGSVPAAPAAGAAQSAAPGAKPASTAVGPAAATAKPKKAKKPTQPNP